MLIDDNVEYISTTRIIDKASYIICNDIVMSNLFTRSIDCSSKASNKM